MVALAHVSAGASERRTEMRLSEYQKQVWGVEDGLPDSNVRQISQTADGRLLLATFSGVITFDGLHFGRLNSSTYGDVSGAAANAVLPGRNGDLWVGTDGEGVVHYRQGQAVNISQRAGFLHERIRDMKLDREGVLWIATHNGVERYENSSLQRLSSAGIVAGDTTTTFAEGLSNNGGMFFITSKGLFLWRNGELVPQEIPKTYGLPVAVYRDRRNRLWIGTWNAVLLVRDESQAQRGHLDVQPVASTGSPVNALAGDADGNLWIGTRHSGLWCVIEGASHQAQHWSTADGLEDETVRSLYVDDEDNLWIGMLTGGLSRWRKAPLAPYGKPEGFASTYAAVTFADSRGNLWLGSWGQGLFLRRGEVTKPMILPGMQPSTPIRAITEDRNRNVWIGTWFDGVYRWTGRRFDHYRLGIESPVNAVSALLADHRGGLWVGTYTGLMHYASGVPDQGSAAHFLENKLVTCLLLDRDGTILVGTSEGLFRIRGKAVVPVLGLPHPYVLSLFEDSLGGVWAGSRYGGLAAVHDATATPLATPGLLANLPIYSGVEDEDGHLWMGSSRGIARVTARELHAALERAPGSGESLNTVVFGKGDGMRSGDCSGPSQPTATRLPDGTLWFATKRGFVHTTPYAETKGPVVPVASVLGSSSSLDAPPLLGNGILQVDPGQQDLLLFFNARYLANPDRVEFRYRLKGYDSEWTITHGRVARYRHMPPGHYVFEVQARMSGTDWQSAPAVLAIRQKPHFYQDWWFYLVVAALFLLVAWELYRRRVRQLRASIAMVAEERNRISRECHDTLMAGFAAVSWQMESIEKRLTAGQSDNALESFGLARSMLTHCQAEARRIIWDLRDSDEITGDLVLALQRAVDAYYREHAIALSLNVDGSPQPLAPNAVHHLVCIGQEAIGNALRHASPSSISAWLRFDENGIELEIRDDGRGFDTSRSLTGKGHFGMAVMEERARKVGGEFRVDSHPGMGTRIRVRIPLSRPGTDSFPLLVRRNALLRWMGI